MHPGANVGLGSDHTIFSLIDGIVQFSDKRGVKVSPIRHLQTAGRAACSATAV